MTESSVASATYTINLQEAEPNDNTTNANTFTLGTSVSGTMSSITDKDFSKVTLTAGTSYTTTVTPPTGKNYYINIYDSSGTLVSSGTVSTITYTPATTGDYYVEVYTSTDFSTTATYQLTVAVNDTTAPTPGSTGTITTSGVTFTSLTLNWTAAIDGVTAQSALTYRVFYSTTVNSIDTVATITSGTEVGSETANIITKSVTGLSSGTTYYFNVVVKDAAGNQAVYTTKSQATTSDVTPPTPGNTGTITTASVSITSLTLNWTKATDVVTAQTSLVYKVYQSGSNNISTVANAEASGTLLNAGGTTDIATYNVTSLTAATTYYFVVIVSDGAANKAIYTMMSQHTVCSPCIYVADYGNNRIVRMDDMSGTGWVSYGTSGSGTGNFSGPSGVYVDSSGKIYVADYLNYRIVRMDDMLGNGWVSYGTSGSGTGNFKWPYGVYVDSSGKIYVSDQGNHRIVRMDDMSGTGWISYGTYGINGTGTGNFANPFGVYVDSSGKINIVDNGNHRIVRMDDMSGNGWVFYGANGTGVGKFALPYGVYVDSSGKINVADYGNNRIVRIDDMVGNGWVSYGTSGSGTGNFSGPRGVYVDSSGKIYVGDAGNNRVVTMDDMSGTAWTTFGTNGSGTNQFNIPSGVFVR